MSERYSWEVRWRDEWEQPYSQTGQATTLPHDEEEDVCEKLRAVVEEVTRKPLPRKAVNKIGFV